MRDRERHGNGFSALHQRPGGVPRPTANHNAEKDACPLGHRYVPQNTYKYKTGRRCRSCVQARVALARLYGEVPREVFVADADNRYAKLMRQVAA